MRGNRSSRLNFVMAAIQVAFIAQQQAAMQDSLFSFIFLIRRLPDTLPSEPVLTVSFPDWHLLFFFFFDWHLRLIPPRQFADEMTGNDLSVFLICRRQPFQCQRRDKEIKQEEIQWNTTCFQWRDKTGDLFIFFFLNTEARPKYDIKKAWSHYRAHWWRSTGRSLLSQRWADYQLWNNSRLALPPTTTTPPNKTPLVTRVHGLPISTSDWMLWFYLSSAASSGSWWQKWQLFAFNTLSLLHGSYKKKKKKKMLCLCLSRTTARHCWDAPKSFYLWTLWHWRGLWLFFSFF